MVRDKGDLTWYGIRVLSHVYIVGDRGDMG